LSFSITLLPSDRFVLLFVRKFLFDGRERPVDTEHVGPYPGAARPFNLEGLAENEEVDIKE
jgi:hypothetical protein